MRGIATALQNQHVRRLFPEGAKLQTVMIDLFIAELRITSLKTGNIVYRYRDGHRIAAMAFAMCRQREWHAAEAFQRAGITPVVYDK